MGTDAALRVVWAPMPHWNAIALSPVVGEHCEVAAHGCFNRGPAFKGDNYVSKALVGIIFDAFWPSAALLGLLAASVLQDASTTFSLCELLASIGAQSRVFAI